MFKYHQIFVCLIVAASVLSSSTADAQVRGSVFFSTTTPCDILTGIGLYVKDVGHKAATGAKTILEGTGSVITSPFRAKFHRPRSRFYRYDRGYLVPPKLERLPQKPPKVDLGDPVPVPTSDLESEIRNTIVLAERKF